jgi:hypothetical protein
MSSGINATRYTAPKGGNQPAQGGATDIVYDDKGVGHRYKGSGARNDPNSYEQVK